MSKHNNNLAPSSKGRCKCGRYMTLGEDRANVWHVNYICPDCLYYQNTKRYENNNITDFYKPFNYNV